MLEHQKFVLNAVADSAELFRKELKKSFLWLNQEELSELHRWLQKEYQWHYGAMIDELFGAAKLETSIA